MLNNAFLPTKDTAPLDPDPDPDPVVLVPGVAEPCFAVAAAEKVGVNTADGLAMHDVAAATAVSAGAPALTTPFPSKEQEEARRPLSS
jgi:hypothetical protein